MSIRIIFYLLVFKIYRLPTGALFCVACFLLLQYLSGEIVIIIRYGYPKIAGVSISF